MVGMRDIAKAANVSLSTVSVVLNNNGKSVRPETAERVRKAAKELNYTFQPKKIRQKAVAVIFSMLKITYYSDVYDAIAAELSKKGTLLFFYATENEFAREREKMELISKMDIEGVILGSVCPIEEEKEYFEWVENEFCRQGIPVVLMERKINSEFISCIYYDYYSGAIAATEHLINMGHRDIAYIAGRKLPHTVERTYGFMDAMRKCGLEPSRDLMVQGDCTAYSGYNCMKELIDGGEKFTAVFSANDAMAIGAIQALKQRGIRIPEDIALIGFDNLAIASLVEPSLSTISISGSQLGRKAAYALNEMCSKGKKGIELQLEYRLIERKSTNRRARCEAELISW